MCYDAIRVSPIYSPRALTVVATSVFNIRFVVNVKLIVHLSRRRYRLKHDIDNSIRVTKDREPRQHSRIKLRKVTR